MQRYWRILLLVMLSGCCLNGCTAPLVRVNPLFSGAEKAMNRILVIPPEIHLVELMPGGGRLDLDDTSRMAAADVRHAIAAQLNGNGYIALTADDATLQRKDCRSLVSLFRAVNHAIRLHVFGPQVFPEKVRQFDYQLGPVDGILSSHGADGLLLALGRQTPGAGPADNWLSIALVDPEGHILWYAIQYGAEAVDFQGADRIRALVASTMASLRTSVR